jgi:hypothetical protein
VNLAGKPVTGPLFRPKKSAIPATSSIGKKQEVADITGQVQVVADR